ncbi:MAG: hypothetical protein HQL16_01605 [Candidatus Omnitrophica bacterium]|nr:hypothetical protein [Candidatus Omnitrophota bacterium]
MLVTDRMPFLKPFFRQKPRKNFLVALWHEINLNLERYFVVEQRQFITEPFENNACHEARTFASLKFPRELTEYAHAVDQFNALFREMKEFEAFYSSSIDKKTKENAEILHQQKESLQVMFNGLRPKIDAAQSSLRRLLEKS